MLLAPAIAATTAAGAPAGATASPLTSVACPAGAVETSGAGSVGEAPPVVAEVAGSVVVVVVAVVPVAGVVVVDEPLVVPGACAPPVAPERRAASVRASTRPVALRPAERWKALTAFLVPGPNWPSAV